jgi:ABC-type Na+ efflux pump permease subunit
MRKETKKEKVTHDTIMAIIAIIFVLLIALGNQIIVSNFVK